jgi:hypothetical protein
MESILACRAAVVRSAFFCARCRKGYSTRDVYLDLTVLATAKEYKEIQKPRTELFRYSCYLACNYLFLVDSSKK